MRAVQPVPDEFLSSDAFALGDLGFVVRENIIDTTRVDIDLIAEQRSSHRAAFDVPAWSARSPWRIPFHVPIFFVPRFPKRKVADVFLVIFVVLHTSGRLQLGEIEVRKLPVTRKFINTEIN